MSAAGGRPTQRLLAALAYARRGWPVIALHGLDNGAGACTCGRAARCESPGKHPRPEHGLLEATTDAGMAMRWWRRWPNSNVGIRTGEAAKLLVLDVDPRHGGDESLAELTRRHGALPDTVEVVTGGGGRHVYLRLARGQVVRSSASTLGEGLDVRGEGGYVVAPPSAHAEGRRYAWEVTSHPDEVEIAPAPAWLVGLLTSRRGAAEPRPVEEWCRLAREGVRQGRRNAEAASLAGHLLRKRVDPALTLELVRAWNEARCKPPLPEAELLGVVDRIAAAELARRTPP